VITPARASLFVPACSGRGLREKFSRLMQMSVILGLDRPQDVVEALGSPVHWKLTPDEIVLVLRQRVDFSEEDIRRVDLAAH
jgi:hypothetical protein